MAFVYLLRCADGSLYCGWSVDVERRIAAHTAGRASRYTASRRPVALAAAWRTATRTDARRLEARVKRMARAQKLRLVAGAPWTRAEVWFSLHEDAGLPPTSEPPGGGCYSHEHRRLRRRAPPPQRELVLASLLVRPATAQADAPALGLATAPPPCRPPPSPRASSSTPPRPIGYACGVVASFVDGPADVRLHRALPLDAPLHRRAPRRRPRHPDHEDVLVAEAHPALPLDLEPPHRVTATAPRPALAGRRRDAGHVWAALGRALAAHGLLCRA